MCDRLPGPKKCERRKGADVLQMQYDADDPVT